MKWQYLFPVVVQKELALVSQGVKVYSFNNVHSKFTVKVGSRDPMARHREAKDRSVQR